AGLETQILNIVSESKPELPDIDEIVGLVIMGGPMNAGDFEGYPGLKKETKLIRNAIERGIPVLGICLGHQIIAHALGAKIARAKKEELGLCKIVSEHKDDYFSMWNKELHVLQWHGDEVSLPEGAQLLASSKVTKNQAFKYRSALGLQFHLEVDGILLQEWLDDKSMVKGLKKSQIEKLKADFAIYDSQMLPLAQQVFTGFAARCATFAQE
ncbi:MAG: type 1 glutamine amidotransferase, partial [Bifidobacteriaceae bacterium]|nr:type 1 glutamine amidotransferase [Bifidobacteriaceae bacterium]